MLLLDKTLLKMTKGLWGWILSLVGIRVCSLVMITSFATHISYFLGNMMNPTFTHNEIRNVVIQILIVSVLIFVFQFIQGELEYRAQAAACSSIRQKLFTKTMSLDAGYIEKIGPNSAITSAVDGVEQMQVYYSVYLPSLIFSVIAPIYLFTKIYPSSFLIACILLVVSFVLLPLHNVFRYRIEKLRKSYWVSLEDMTGYYLDSIRGLSTLKLFDQSDKHAEVLGEKADYLNHQINEFMKVNFTSFLVTEGIIYITLFVCVLIAVSGLSNQTMELSTVLMILLLGYSYFGSIRQLMSATHDALTAVSAASRAEEILAVKTTEIKQEKQLIQYQDGIVLKDVSFSYEGRKEVLHHVNITIEKSKTTALVGLSGCGKSTIASMLMKFIYPASGVVYLNGIDYACMNREEIGKQIVMVPQTVNLFSDTIRNNLLLANPSATDEELWKVLEEVSLDKHIRRMKDGLDTMVSESGSNLSGGQKQMMGIARALLTDAEYIIFDEATSAVDPESETIIWQCIKKLSKKRTLIIISHRLSAIRNADQIIVLQAGIVEEVGNHEQLMKNHGLYRTLVEEQNELEVQG
ncbi:ATP-binding cassette domain-containing protein [Solobacterium sp.]|uniref:ABC transporter ATP-binding protein/permease n=1 Tax=Solobacterium sp. TaxID=2060878 RepID=UPI001CB156DE|nr:ATP-binding cassette domain-containing protein [Solobacterium sp.]MBF1085550.1 ATP-binding cassette domain-containing protein [Solobacterium sp.]MBF1103064.1 ATP-binding cassette domain-containing protein [Solobacterium sp.]